MQGIENMKWTVNVDKIMKIADNGLKEEDIFTKEQILSNRRNRLKALKELNREEEKKLEKEMGI